LKSFVESWARLSTTKKVLSAEALATVVFSVLQPMAMVPSPTPLTDAALQALAKDTELFLSWHWCAASFKLQRTRSSQYVICGSHLSHTQSTTNPSKKTSPLFFSLSLSFFFRKETTTTSPPHHHNNVLLVHAYDFFSLQRII